jgi:hypothetical protein
MLVDPEMTIKEVAEAFDVNRATIVSRRDWCCGKQRLGSTTVVPQLEVKRLSAAISGTADCDPSRKWLFSPSSPSGQSITALRNVSRSGSFAPDRNLNAVEIRWPFRLGLQGRIVDRSQDLGWQRAFGHGRKIVPEVLQRRGADDDAIIAFGVEL